MILLAQLIGSPFAIIIAGLEGLIVAVVSALRHPTTLFLAFLALQLLVLALRIAFIEYFQRSSRSGKLPLVDLAPGISMLWCTLQGCLAFSVMLTGDAPLMILATTLIMATVGPICARNYAAPRLALLLVSLCVIPLLAGGALTGEPLLIFLLLLSPAFLYGTYQIIQTFQRILVATLEAEARNAFQAHHDQLTGLLNRHGLEAVLDALPGPDDETLAILCVDLDHFKAVNDKYGHITGDKLLEGVARRLEKAVRQADTVARTGGDEFILVLRNMHLEDVERTADRLIACVSSKPYRIDGSEFSVGASVGYACMPDDAVTINELRLKADIALYAVKNSERGRRRRFVPRIVA